MALRSHDLQMATLAGVYAGFVVRHRDQSSTPQLRENSCGPNPLEGHWEPQIEPTRSMIRADGIMSAVSSLDLMMEHTRTHSRLSWSDQRAQPWLLDRDLHRRTRRWTTNCAVASGIGIGGAKAYEHWHNSGLRTWCTGD